MSAAAILACGPTAISLCVSAAGIDRPVKEHPILMSGEMVRAILDGRKTQTRRQDLKAFGGAGDMLWVRETFYKGDSKSLDGKNSVIYRASFAGKLDCKWKPSIHMPRTAARIILEITETRTERLNDISEADAIAEGVRLKGSTRWAYQAREEYRNLWERINGAGSWAFNPMVKVISFRALNPTPMDKA